MEKRKNGIGFRWEVPYSAEMEMENGENGTVYSTPGLKPKIPEWGAALKAYNF